MTAPSITVGPFTWVKRIPNAEGMRRGSTEEVWELQRPDGFTSFCLKNYGGKPNDRTGFSGIRLVSGGPFCTAGGWTEFDKAFVEVVPWLTAYYQDEAKKLLEKANRMIQFATNFSDVVSAGEHLRGGV